MDQQINSKQHISSADRYLEFCLGGESYAVELLKVKEVTTVLEITPIPKSEKYVCGLMNLRGLVLTVIDLRMKLGIVPDSDNSQNAIIIFDLENRLVGVKVDSIQKVLNVNSENLKPVPDEDIQQNGHLLGVLQNEQKITMLINLNTLFTSN